MSESFDWVCPLSEVEDFRTVHLLIFGRYGCKCSECYRLYFTVRICFIFFSFLTERQMKRFGMLFTFACFSNYLLAPQFCNFDHIWFLFKTNLINNCFYWIYSIPRLIELMDKMIIFYWKITSSLKIIS
jgi:hypothetical protein